MNEIMRSFFGRGGSETVAVVSDPLAEAVPKWEELKRAAARAKSDRDRFLAEHFANVNGTPLQPIAQTSFEGAKLYARLDELDRAMCEAVTAERQFYAERIHPFLPKPARLTPGPARR